MRTMLALLAFVSVSAFAQRVPTPVFPRVFNLGNSVTVEAWNHNDMYVSCSGSVWMQTESGKLDSEYVHMMVPPRGFRSYRVYARDMNDRIRSVNHSIWCN